MSTKQHVNETAYAKFLNKLATGKPIRIRNTVSGEVQFTLCGDIHYMKCNQVLNVSQIGSLRDLKLATQLHDLIRSGRLSVE